MSGYGHNIELVIYSYLWFILCLVLIATLKIVKNTDNLHTFCKL